MPSKCFAPAAWTPCTAAMIARSIRTVGVGCCWHAVRSRPVRRCCLTLGVRCTGRLWVTAPAGPIAPAPYRRSFEAPFGRVYCVYRSDRAEAEADRPRHAASSSAAEPHFAIAQVDTGLWFPNGIAVSADGAHLYVAETGTKTIWRYDITGCSLGNKQAWATVPGDHAGGPDGMDFDAEGTAHAPVHAVAPIPQRAPAHCRQPAGVQLGRGLRGGA